jgi:hypothetical protein
MGNLFFVRTIVGDQHIDAPLIALDEALQSSGIPAERFRALPPGQVWQSAALRSKADTKMEDWRAANSTD